MSAVPPARPRRMGWPAALALLLAPAAAMAQTTSGGAAAPAAGSQDAAWRRCAALSGDNAARLACFDAWAGQQAWQAPAASAVAGGSAPGSATAPAVDPNAPAKPVDTTLPATRIIDVARTEGCRDPQYSDLSRFWELESGSDCGTFSFRGYRPITVSVVASDSVNRQPTSTAAGRSATESTPYRTTENRIQLSVRTKLAQGLLTQGHPTLKDSVWFGYSQQSYWQLFTPQISRPFRSTDHEPEIMYVYPTTAQLPFGWRWRYSGVGLVHQSNGQSNPLSRSWNRVMFNSVFERGNFAFAFSPWYRLPEAEQEYPGDPDGDDNPDITDYLGNFELNAAYQRNDDIYSLMLRDSLDGTSRGAIELGWSFPISSNLRGQFKYFNGYGHSLIDYNVDLEVFALGIVFTDLF